MRLVAAGERGHCRNLETDLQDIAITAALLDNFPLSKFTDFPFDDYAMFLAVLVTIYSLYDYIKKNLHVINIDK